MNIISRCQTHFCLIPGGMTIENINLYYNISFQVGMTINSVAQDIADAGYANSLLRDEVLFLISPSRPINQISPMFICFSLNWNFFLLSKSHLLIGGVIFSNNWEWVWTHISDGLRINFGLQTYQMDAYDHPRINFPSLDINRISFVTRAITNLSSTHWYIFYFGS